MMDKMGASIEIRPIGFVRGGRGDPVDDGWDNVAAEIVLDAGQFAADAASGLDAFSHIDVIFHFDRARTEDVNTGARHPRGRKEWPLVGIFAQRGKDRPNRIGLTTCRLLSVDGLILSVRGLDAIDGTPVLDIKPVMTGFLPRGEIVEPAWARELMSEYW